MSGSLLGRQRYDQLSQSRTPGSTSDDVYSELVGRRDVAVRTRRLEHDDQTLGFTMPRRDSNPVRNGRDDLAGAAGGPRHVAPSRLPASRSTSETTVSVV